ncbi:type IVB secretion system protein IcmH/DotU [Marinomonas posidonica]|uniref:Type IV / VI secretion system protein, DotU family n=1 Tax=Marinomonas posidonica (strain CECT 7376 / NCIMB 14433 / IVIA-Po-181) TaxID=491952 RepID=F6D0Z9_MARPP|nr:type IVB secretion system protein IcmH/DotU [Marinomonas posidonica]AEF53722.1 type IV / VI secretion system protein, DotU family [Marinomonas posidonica IVIA-Po-181]
MNDFLDEETVAFKIESDEKSQINDDGYEILDNANPLKNASRYAIDLQKYQFFDNKILSASSELLSIAVSIARIQAPEDMYLFRAGLKRAVADLKNKVAALDYPPSVADKVCFLFCIMLDEQVLHSSWGEESGWENQTLVSELFGMKNGGEQFYLIAERALSQPILLVDLIELIYILLKMGFRGQYRVNSNNQLESLLKRLENAIFSQLHIVEKKDGYGVGLSEDISKVKFTKPKPPVKYWRQFLLFILLIISVLVAISYWYEETLSQRGRSFYGLESFTEEYYRPKGDGKEFTYLSTPEEMASNKKVTLTSKSNETVTTNDLSTSLKSEQKTVSSISGSNNADGTESWIVQIATYSTLLAANNYVLKIDAVVKDAKIIKSNKLFKVVVETDNKNTANNILKKVKAFGVDDAFIIHSTKVRQ